MARGPRYNLPFRRKRERKTDYKKRKALVSSGIPRIVIRGSSKHMTVQIVEAKPKGDQVLAAAKSSHLSDLGWKRGFGNTPAAYLTGLMAGVRAIRRGVHSAIADIGLRRPTKGSRIFAALKGAIDSGIKVPHGEGVFPEESRIKGKHIVDYATLLSKNPKVYGARFSEYLRKGTKPEDLPSQFEQVRSRIIQNLSER